MKPNYWKLLGTAFLAWYFMSYAVGDPQGTLANWNFVDNVDLVIHEAGHIIFLFFGDFLHILGGSLTQILVPAIFAGYFFLRRQYFSGSVVLFWVGENVISVATYMGDAVVQQLPLLGGDGVIHDWNYLLSATGLLKYTIPLSNITHGIGVLLLIAAAVLCVRFSFEEKT
jgi:hypothetical protein